MTLPCTVRLLVTVLLPALLCAADVTLGVVASDDGGNGQLTYAWAQSAGPATSITYTVNNSGAASTTVASFPADAPSGSYTFTVTVSDAEGLSTQVDCTVTVAHDAPRFASAIAGPVTIAAGGVSGALPFTVVDDQTAGGALTVTAYTDDPLLLPAGGLALATVNAGQRTLTITPAAGHSGGAVVTLTVSDGTHTASSAVTVTVAAAGGAPPPPAASGQSGGCGAGAMAGLLLCLLCATVRRR